MTTASKADYELIESLKKANALRDMDRDRIPDEQGTIIITCADGDRITDILTHHWNICNGHHCHHTISLNGGPLLIPKSSPVATIGEGEVILSHMYNGHRLKKMTTIVPYGHWPCGAALMAKMTLEETLDLYVLAKDTMRQYLEAHDLNPAIVPCFHIDYMEGGKASYYFDRKSWAAWKASRKQAKLALELSAA